MRDLPPATPDRIRSHRLAAGQTQREAAATVRSTLRTWQKWEYGDRGMSQAIWELYLIKTGFIRPRVRRR